MLSGLKAFAAWPNSFNPQTTISFAIAQNQHVAVRIYDLNGHLVNTLCNEHKSAGKHEFVWLGRDDNGKRVGSGTYLVQVKGEVSEQTQKIMLIK